MVAVASLGVSPGAETETCCPTIGLPVWSSTRYWTAADAAGATTAGTSVLTICVPTTWTGMVLTTVPDVTVTVMSRLARLPPMDRLAVSLPAVSVVRAPWEITPSLSAENDTVAPPTTTRAASMAVAVTVTELDAVFVSWVELAVTMRSAATTVPLSGGKGFAPDAPPPPPQAARASSAIIESRR